MSLRPASPGHGEAGSLHLSPGFRNDIYTTFMRRRGRRRGERGRREGEL